MKYLKISLAAFFLIFSFVGYAQKATEANRPQDSPVDFGNPTNVILLIVIPIAFFILYLIWRNVQKKDRLKAEEQMRKENLEMGKVERTDKYKDRE
ncbi:MAG TPA: hypothetical protein VFF21_00465 [Flavobacteriaceae bacterium]|nr:hypothetical protein [Flavobacteriaceae bacterium]